MILIDTTNNLAAQNSSNITDWIALGIAAIAVIISIIGLTKSKKNQKDISDLASLKEDEVRLKVKPHIWQNGCGFRADKRIHAISLNNKGERAYVEEINILNGDVELLTKPKYEIEKGEEESSIWARPSKGQHPKDVEFEFEVIYRDELNFFYKITVHWVKGHIDKYENIELGKKEK